MRPAVLCETILIRLLDLNDKANLLTGQEDLANTGKKYSSACFRIETEIKGNMFVVPSIYYSNYFRMDTFTQVVGRLRERVVQRSLWYAATPWKLLFWLTILTLSYNIPDRTLSTEDSIDSDLWQAMASGNVPADAHIKDLAKLVVVNIGNYRNMLVVKYANKVTFRC